LPRKNDPLACQKQGVAVGGWNGRQVSSGEYTDDARKRLRYSCVDGFNTGMGHLAGDQPAIEQTMKLDVGRIADSAGNFCAAVLQPYILTNPFIHEILLCCDGAL